MSHPSPIRRQRLFIVASVLLLHGLALWGLQSGLLQRAAALVEEIVVPVSVITEPPVVSKPAPQPAPAPPPPKPPPPTPTRVTAPTPAPALAAPSPVAPAAPQPAPQAIADPSPSANAATGVSHAQPAPAVVAPGPVAAPVSKTEPPLTEADYLEKPKRAYPLRCYRRGEQGTVLVHVLIGADGNAVKAEVATSSGFPCLNREAVDSAMAARYKPLMRAGVPVEAWRDASYKFVLPE